MKPLGSIAPAKRTNIKCRRWPNRGNSASIRLLLAASTALSVLFGPSFIYVTWVAASHRQSPFPGNLVLVTTQAIAMVVILTGLAHGMSASDRSSAAAAIPIAIGCLVVVLLGVTLLAAALFFVTTPGADDIVYSGEATHEHVGLFLAFTPAPVIAHIAVLLFLLRASRHQLPHSTTARKTAMFAAALFSMVLVIPVLAATM